MHTYKVLCAKTKECCLPWEGKWIPINGSSHNDPEIGVLWPHYHVDWRFVGIGERENLKNRFYHFQNPTDYYFLVIAEDDVEIIEYRTFHEKSSFEPLDYFANWVPVLAKKYVGMECKGKKCPHKGADLSDCIPNEFGSITCPYHGLLIDNKSMKVLSRTAYYDKR